MQGSCLCGAVRYTISGPARAVVACHCGQCRKTSGHYVAATRADDSQLAITGLEAVTWFQSSAQARRGFCRHCGSPLFWKETGSDRTSIMAGSIDGRSGLVMDRQLHAASKADYYALPDCPVIDQAAL